MSSVPMACLDCGDPTRYGNRCRACSIRHHAPYVEPEYLRFVVTGLCFWGCGRPATVRDHVIGKADGGRAADNLVGSCVPCNARRGGLAHGA